MGITDKRDLERLIQQLSNPSVQVQAEAIDALRRLGDQAVPALRKLIPCKMCNQIVALSTVGYPANAGAISELVEELRYSGSFPPKDALISSTLCEIGPPALDRLQQVLNEHPEDAVWVHEVAFVLLSFDRSQIQNLTDSLIYTLQVGLEGDAWYYTNVIKLLGRIGSPHANGAIPIICQYYEQFRKKAKGAEGPLHSDRLAQASRQASEDIRKAAMSGLSQLDVASMLSARETIELAGSDPVQEIATLASDILTRFLNSA